MNIREASNICLGLAAISEVYYGSTKLWPANYANNYFTVSNIGDTDSTWNIRIPVAVTEAMLPAVSYSLDNGTTWTTTNNDSSKSTYMTISIPVEAGKSALVKASATQWGTSTSTFADNARMYASSTATEWSVSGNIMSLAWGDEFVGKTAFPNNNECWFAGLFAYNNSSINPLLVDASHLVLPATSVPASAYRFMFYNRTGLTGAPALTAATTTSYNVYTQMFDGCSSLVTPPALPSLTSLATGIYAYMFRNCTSLTETPQLDFSNVTSFYANACLQMFMNDTALETIEGSIIVANNSVSRSNIFKEMFKGCTSLEETCYIGLSSSADQESIYFTSMFEDCTSLNKIYISSSWTAPMSSTFTTDWVKNVAASGTFYDYSPDTVWNQWGDSYIPTGWTRVPEYIDYSTQYFTIETTDNSNVPFKFYIGSNSGLSYIEYSIDNGTNWTKLNKASGSTASITTPSTNKVMLRGSGSATGFNSDTNAGLRLTIDGNNNKTCKVSGNINSLLYPDSEDFSDLDNYKTSNYVYQNLFMKQDYYACNFFVTSAKNLILPKYTGNRAYYQMFKDQTQLVTGPDMSNVITLADYAAHSMFIGCSALTSTPDLSNVTTFGGYACYQMFKNCTSLTTLRQLGKEVGTITLSAGNYNMSYMFAGCTALVDASTANFKMASASYAANSSNHYSYMFSGCTSLTTCFDISFAFSNTVTYSCAFMFNGCTSLTKTPEIICYRTKTSVTSTNAFRYCFSNCTSLSKVTVSDETNYYSNGVFYGWLDNVASTGQFINYSSMTFDANSTSGVPSGWTLTQL